MCNLLQISRGWSMADANISGPNEAAIDLIRDDHQLAVQVTIDATATKVRKTSKKLTSSQYESTLKKIYVTGIHNCPTGTPDSIDKRIERITPIDLLGIYDTNLVDSAAVEKMWTYLQNETRLRTMLAVDDREAFDYILAQLRCGAIRHTNFMEGNYARMSDRITKLRELIHNGMIDSVIHPSKPVIQFEDKSYRNFLLDITDSLELINSIMDQSGQDLTDKYATVDIGQKAAGSINEVKLQIMRSIDEFCKIKGHSHDVTPVSKIYWGDEPEDD